MAGDAAEQSASGITGLTREHALALLGQMLRIRQFEDRCAQLYTEQKIRGFLHLYNGEEAVATGVIPALRAMDAIVATYREHGHALVRGLPMNALMAEMYGKQTGSSRGRGGSMHVFDAARRFYGGNAIVGGGLPLAVGVALADKLAGRDALTACFFGEGAVAEGEFHESLNLATLWQLPVLFVCENNLYAMGTALARSESVTDIHAKAAAYGLPAQTVDGMDVCAVENVAATLTAAIRAGGGPRFLECRTYRLRPHSMFDAQLYRDKAEIEAWRARGPLITFTTRCKAAGLIEEADYQRLERAAASEVDAAVAFAEQSPWEPVETLATHVYAEQDAPAPVAATAVSVQPGQRISYREALRQALRDALQSDARVFLMGEDIGRYGGCYAVTKGLLAEFGEARIRDTPLSESGFVGAGIGAALGGMRPIVEIMTVNFSLLALDQIVNNAATLNHMSGGQCPVPVVIRMATGGGRQVAAQHSHSLEGWYAHIPGLRIVAPATIDDARGMLAAALRSPDPVLIFEHVGLLNMEGDLTPAAATADLEHAAIRRNGRDLTAITYGASLYKCLDAANQLAADGIEMEVVDLRSLRPLDDAAFIASIRRTHRALIVDEGWRSGGISAEIGMRIAEQAFYDLDAPLARVCAMEVPIPYPKHLEDAALPSVSAIVAAARGMIKPA
jgi:pyruvate dehydrogenase E1 component beta subunit/2-oxoisovalerate dehydrogenase E1 component